MLNPIKRGLDQRKNLVNKDKLLVPILKTGMTETQLSADSSKAVPIMSSALNLELGLFRFKSNTKEIDPISAAAYDIPYNDTMDPDEIVGLVKTSEFDFALWFKDHPNFSMDRILDYNLPFFIQVGGCNAHDGTPTGGCMYCFVDNESNDCVVAGKYYLGIDEAIDSMLLARERISEIYQQFGKDVNIKLLRVSGGEPTLALDWILKLWDRIAERGLDFVGQFDTNLTTSRIIKKLIKEGIYDKHIIKRLAEHPIKVLTAIKGVDQENLMANLQTASTMKIQEESIDLIVKGGFDNYFQIYNANSAAFPGFLEALDSKIPYASSKIFVAKINVYGPTIDRIKQKANETGADPDKFLEQTVNQWATSTESCKDILNDHLIRVGMPGYKEGIRSDIDLR